MKKLAILAAAATIVASSAAAVTSSAQKVKHGGNKVELVSPRTLKIERQRAQKARQINPSKSVMPTDEIPGLNDNEPITIGAGDAHYCSPSSAFYMGMAPNYYSWNPYGFAGIRNAMVFSADTLGQDKNIWNYIEIVEDETGELQAVEHDGEGYKLQIEAVPYKEYTSPVLGSIFGTDTVAYMPEVPEYFCGGGPFNWGFYADNTTDTMPSAEYVDPAKVYGVYDCAAPITSDCQWWPEMAIYYPPTTITSSLDAQIAQLFDSNGVSKLWTEVLGYAYPSLSFKSVKINGFTTFIPAKMSPYQISAMWMYFVTETTAEVPLTATIYPVNAAGSPDFDHPIARGSYTLPVGEFPSATDDLPIFYFEALDEDGIETDEVPCVGALQHVVVRLSGLENPNIKYFLPLMNGATSVALDQDPDNYWPTHAYANLTMEVGNTADPTAPTTTIDNMFMSPYPYYANSEMTELIYLTDFLMFFDASYPVVYNPEDETANFSVSIPTAGGSDSVVVLSDYIITSVLEEGYMTAEATEDWISFDYEAIDLDGYPCMQVVVKADALPEGEEGRQGYVVFSGFGLDFYITVNQGKVAGIQAVEASHADGPVEYFDLQGRRLLSAPNAGLYLQRQGNTATKRLAH